MTTASSTNRSGRGDESSLEDRLRPESLRADLSGISVDRGGRSARIIIDDIGGRFARVPDHLWRMLVGGNADAKTWASAKAAGWTRRRRAQSDRRKLFGNQSPLAIRVPFFNVDSVARGLSGGCQWIFAPAAVKFWTTMMVAALLLAISQYRELVDTLGQMPSFFSSTSAWLLGTVFVGTKLLHELGHAVACARAGVRCGTIGVFFFCGMPCPYCDVTQVWRNPSARTRAGVMLAGMYVEGVLATIATLVWALADDGPVRFHAMNVMIVCSVSTLLFNANPLMRYDGYYVLSDWINSVNLRAEARSAFRDFKSCFETRRKVGLSAYYLASTVYRYLVLMTIATAIFVFADSVGLKLIAAAGLLAMLILMIGKAVSRAVQSWRGGRTKRLFVVGLSGAVLGLVLLMPVPRRVTAIGFIDVADAAEVFLTAEGVIDSVSAAIGQKVVAGEPLVKVRDDGLSVETVAALGQLKVASFRSRTARRQSLKESQSSNQLESFEAVEEALTGNLVSLRQRNDRLTINSPRSGIVLPTRQQSELNRQPPWEPDTDLTQRIGMRSEKGIAWCRIASSTQVVAVLQVDAKHRESVKVAMVVHGHELQRPNEIQAYRVLSISSVSASSVSASSVSGSSVSTGSRDSRNHRPTFEVLAEQIGSDQDDANWLSRMGGTCRAVIDLPSRSLGADIVSFLKELLS